MTYHQFERHDGEVYGSFETFLWDRFDCQDAGLIEQDSGSDTGWVAFDFGIGGTYRFDVDPADFEGWFWQACFPGCLPDGDLMGPFASEDDAISHANSLS